MFRFGMFNSINGDRRYKAEDFAQYFATFIGNGIFVKPSDCLQIRANGDSMSVIVRPGKAWVNGYYLINDEDYNLPLVVGDATLNRIDRIVIKLDFILRKMSVEVKKGVLSASPVAPTLKRDADAYELALADVYIAKGSLTINQAAITDTRLNNSLCGLMHGVVNQVDATTIFDQYQQWFEDYSVTKAAEFLQWQTKVTTDLEAWIDAQEKDFEAWRQAEEALYYTWLQGRKDNFDAWFETVKDILDTTADGKLFNRQIAHEEASMPHVFLDEVDAKTYQYGFKSNTERDGTVFMFKDTNDPQAQTTTIVGPTKKVQDEIREKVDNVGYLQDVNGDIYKPRMDENIMVKDSYPKVYSNDFIGVMNSEFAFVFSNQTVIKYDVITMKVIKTVLINNVSGNVVINAQDRGFTQDDTHIYFIFSVSGNSNIIKMRKDDMSYIASPTMTFSVYGYINSLSIVDDKLVAAHIDGGTSSIYVFNKDITNLNGYKKLAVGGFLTDFIIDPNKDIISISRNGGTYAAMLYKYKLDGTMISSYTTPIPIYNSGSDAAGRLYLSDKNGKLYVTLRATSYFGEIDQTTLVPTGNIGVISKVDMFLMPSADVFEFISFEVKVVTRMDVVSGQLISKIPIEKDLALNQIMPRYVGPDSGLYGGGTYNGIGAFVSLKSGYVISHYERSV